MSTEYLCTFSVVSRLRCSMLIGAECGRLCRPKLEQALKAEGPNKVWNLDFVNSFGPDYSFLGEFLAPVLANGAVHGHDNTPLLVTCTTDGELENLIRGISWTPGQPNMDISVAQKRIREEGRFCVALDTTNSQGPAYHYLGTDEIRYLQLLQCAEKLDIFTYEALKEHLGTTNIADVVDAVRELEKRRHLFAIRQSSGSGQESRYCSLASVIRNVGKM